MKHLSFPWLPALALAVCGTALAGDPVLTPPDYPVRHGPLTDTELAMAKVAWRYFENNYQPDTGLVNAVDGYPSTTMWDTASYLGGLVSAYELGIIDKQTFDARLVRLLRTLNGLDFFQKELPNKVYHTKTAEKVNYANKPGEIGFSALDLGRMLVWLKIIKERYPEHGNAIDSFVLRWDFTHAVDRCGTLFGAVLDEKSKTPSYVQEGRLGYEEYAAKGFQLWGFSTCMASRPEPYQTIPVYCVNVPYDTRDPRLYSQHNYVVSESYVLDGIELGWDLPWDRASRNGEYSDRMAADFAKRVYQAQENRYRVTGKVTARSEHQLDTAPYFVYDTVYSDGYAWNTITDTGKYVPEFAAVSLKAALGMWVLWNSPYTDLLATSIWHEFVPEKGYYEGVYENGKGPIKTFTANNNGIMLEALLFKVRGKLLTFNPAAPRDTRGPGMPFLWEQQVADPFQAENRLKNRPGNPAEAVRKDAYEVQGATRGWFRSRRQRPVDQQLGFFPSEQPLDSGQCPTCPVCPVCEAKTPVVLPPWSSCR